MEQYCSPYFMYFQTKISKNKERKRRTKAPGHEIPRDKTHQKKKNPSVGNSSSTNHYLGNNYMCSKLSHKLKCHIADTQTCVPCVSLLRINKRNLNGKKTSIANLLVTIFDQMSSSRKN